MRRSLLLALILCGVCACGAEKARGEADGAHVVAPLDPTAFAALRRNMLAAHATFDGAPVIDLRETRRCDAVIVTRLGSTPFRWADMGNLASRLAGNQTTFNIPAGGRPHTLSARTGTLSDRIDMSLNLLDSDCGGV